MNESSHQYLLKGYEWWEKKSDSCVTNYLMHHTALQTPLYNDLIIFLGFTAFGLWFPLLYNHLISTVCLHQDWEHLCWRLLLLWGAKLILVKPLRSCCILSIIRVGQFGCLASCMCTPASCCSICCPPSLWWSVTPWSTGQCCHELFELL